MKITKLKEVKIPNKSHELDCGLDMYLLDDVTLKPLETVCLNSGLSMEIPEGYAGVLVPRSSIAKKGIVIHPAIIDPGYKGEVHIIATNCSNNTYEFKKNDRLCSLVCYNVLNATINPENNRGTGGLGSTGK